MQPALPKTVECQLSNLDAEAEWTFASWFAEVMRRNGWTQEYVAEQVRVSQSTVAQWLRRRNRPDCAYLEPIARLAEVEPI